MAHLLVVDDEPSIRELLEISFRKEGHKVETEKGEGAEFIVELPRSTTARPPQRSTKRKPTELVAAGKG